MRRFIKFLHSVAAAGMTGAMAAMVVVLIFAPTAADPAGMIPVLTATAQMATWVLAPCLFLTVLSGLLAMVASPGYLDAGWVWVKAATGILVLEGGLKAVGPVQEEAKRSAAALATDPTAMARLFEAQMNTLYILLGVAIVNIALGVWRPRLPQYPIKD